MFDLSFFSLCGPFLHVCVCVVKPLYKSILGPPSTTTATNQQTNQPQEEQCGTISNAGICSWLRGLTITVCIRLLSISSCSLIGFHHNTQVIHNDRQPTSQQARETSEQSKTQPGRRPFVILLSPDSVNNTQRTNEAHLSSVTHWVP